MSSSETAGFTLWTTKNSLFRDTGSWRSALPVHEWRPSPCHVACPAGGNIPLWVRQLNQGAYEAAWLTIASQNPLPAVTGRVCHHPCEADCNRTEIEGAVSINALEQFLADEALAQGWDLPEPGPDRGKRVAVVGGGPAGLACAYRLRRLGYAVTIFEARRELGGLLRYGIPEYRLPKAVLRHEIQRLLDLGVEARTATPIADASDFAGVQAEFDAVFLALGAQSARRLPHLQGEDGLPVFAGLDLLYWANEDASVFGSSPEMERRLGGDVVVIGGGSAAMDVARTARRLGKSVSVVFVEERFAMPAQRDEILAALEEGVALLPCVAVQSVARGAEGRLRFDCSQVTLDPNVPSGTVRPLPIPGTGFELAADSLLVSVGQEAVLRGFESLAAAPGSVLQVDEETLATSQAGVFAGGDVSNSHDRFVSHALGDGDSGALAIAAYLGDPEVRLPRRYGAEEVVGPKQVNLYYFPISPRQEREHLEASDRLRDFREAARPLSVQQARDESGRCLSCGTCLECDNCFLFCPDMAVEKKSGREVAYSVLEQYCKGCGLCVAECPRGVVRLTQEQK